MIYQITHTTEYKYHHPVSLCHNIAKLLMRDSEKQFCKNVEVIISPKPDVVKEYNDFFGNKVMYFAVQQEHKLLSVTVQSTIEKMTENVSPKSLKNNISWEDAKRILMQPGEENFDARKYIPFTEITMSSDDILAFTLQSFTPGRSLIDSCKDLMGRINKEFKFTPGFTTISTPLTVVMNERKGVCQDFAHLAIACIRSIGLPARYMSGYLETLPPNGKEKLVGVDASHAWFAVYVPQIGWVEFDPTNNIIPADHHLTIGWGRDYADVAPLKGIILSSGHHHLKVSVDVSRLG